MEEPLKVFISYARRDASHFAEELVTGLEVAGFDAFLDRHDIAPGENWETRLDGLIAAADTVVFVVSPAAVASDRCAWEVSKALELSKRILPVVAQRVPSGDVPPALASLNFIFFDGDRSYSQSLKDLATALRTDVDWLREHTRLADLARRWQTKGEPAALLLQSSELLSARSWLAGARGSQTRPTESHIRFIEASVAHELRSAELERERLAAVAVEQAAKEEALSRLSRRTMIGIATAGGLVVAAAGLAYWALDAERRFRFEADQAEEARKRSLDALVDAESKRTDISGQMIAYSTGPGRVSIAGAIGTADPYTAIAIEELSRPDPNRSIASALSAAHEAFRRGRRTEPFISTTMNGDIYLHRPSKTRTLSALVIGATFPEARTDNSAIDAAAWTGFLTQVGFDVVTLLDPTLAECKEALTKLGLLKAERPMQGERFEATGAMPDALFVLFYTGIGVYADRRNYLGFRDTDALDETTAAATSIDLDALQRSIRSAVQASVIVLDAHFFSPSPPAGI